RAARQTRAAGRRARGPRRPPRSPRIGRRVAGERAMRGVRGAEVLGGRQPRAAAVLRPLVGRERASLGDVAGRESRELLGNRRAGRAARVLGLLAMPLGAAVLKRRFRSPRVTGFTSLSDAATRRGNPDFAAARAARAVARCVLAADAGARLDRYREALLPG